MLNGSVWPITVGANNAPAHSAIMYSISRRCNWFKEWTSIHAMEWKQPGVIWSKLHHVAVNASHWWRRWLPQDATLEAAISNNDIVQNYYPYIILWYLHSILCHVVQLAADDLQLETPKHKRCTTPAACAWMLATTRQTAAAHRIQTLAAYVERHRIHARKICFSSFVSEN